MNARKTVRTILFFVLFLIPWKLPANTGISGLYKTLFYHSGTQFYNIGNVIITEMQVGGKPVFGGNVKVYFGSETSNEFLIYDFAFEECELLFGTSKLTCKNAKNDVSVSGVLNATNGTYEGIWYSKLQGPIGNFVASKKEQPKPAEDAILVNPIAGFYEGPFVKTNPKFITDIDDISLTLITAQDVSGADPVTLITGSLRVFLTGLEGLYFDVNIENAQFNYYNRFLTLQTESTSQFPALSLRGYLSNDGIYKSAVTVNGIGAAGTVEMKLQTLTTEESNAVVE